MSLTVQTNALRTALSSLSKVSASKLALPVLACVHLTAKTFQGLILEATDLEMGLRIYTPGADDDLNIAVPAKTLAEVVAAAGEETLKLSIEDGQLLIVGKGIKSRIAIQDAGEYPSLPYCEHSAVTLAANLLKLTLKKIVIATSNDLARPALASIQIAQADAKITFAAADGFRLAVQEVNGTLDLPGDQKSFCVPASAVRKLIPMLPDDNQDIAITVNEQVSQVGFSWPGFDVFISLTESKFPDWKQIIPINFKHTISLSADFPQAVKRAEVFGRLGGHLVSIAPSAEGAVVRGFKDDSGESRTVLEGVVMPFSLGLNAIFLAQGLEAIGVTAGVHLHLNTSNAPAMLTNGSRDYVYLIMPMLINETTQAAEAAEKSVAAESQA
jgi:DNA polymerase-3 subunit beta